MVEEKIFKNPNRDKPQILTAEEYVPEHVKMMIEPNIYKPSKDQEIAMRNEQQLKKTLHSAPKRKILSASKSTKEAQAESGMSWVGNVSNSIPNMNMPKQPSFREVEQRLMEEEAEEAKVNSEISEDEVNMPGENKAEQASSSFEFASLIVGEYVLVFKDSVVETGSAEDIGTALTTILNGIDQTNISIDDFVVLKRVPVEAGVFVDRSKF